MIKYRLLRDNKESGPYSEEEMIAKGFKPYDLLWAEGKTAGWQYPSEIAPFKKFAPIVEEQPYDRFYKKQPAQNTAVAENRNTFSSYQAKQAKEKNVLKEMAATVQPAAVAYNYNLKDLPARHIHVTLPSGNTVNLTTLVAKNDQKPKETAQNNNSSSVKVVLVRSEEEQKHLSFAGTTTIASTNVASTPAITEATRDISFAKDSKQQVIQLPVFQSSQTGFSWSLLAAAFIGIATMVGLGIMIGLSMNREKNNAAFNEAIARRSNPVQQSVRPAASNSLPAVPVISVSEHSTNTVQQPGKKELIQNAVIKNQPGPDAPKDITKTITEKPFIEKKNIVQHPETSLPQLKTTNAALVEKQLSLRENDFKTGAFGGISNLKFTLLNGSSVPLESVQVEIDYILASKKVYKTETIFFKDIGAGAQLTIDAPASSRGVKVSSRIRKINTKDAALSASASTAKS